jgi:glutamine amidotransferase
VTPRVALVDYRAGNLTSVRKALAAVGADVITPGTASALRDVDAILVPGVGHFGATQALDEDWRDGIRAALARGCPLLGICLGLQWLFEGSDEAPAVPGLGLLNGRCALIGTGKLADAEPVEVGNGIKVPHVGWNAVLVVRDSRLLAGVESGSQAYFTHSYAAPVTADATATTVHGERFASVVERGLAFGVQFHPEKSGQVGLTVLRNFLAGAAG